MKNIIWKYHVKEFRKEILKNTFNSSIYLLGYLWLLIELADYLGVEFYNSMRIWIIVVFILLVFLINFIILVKKSSENTIFEEDVELDIRVGDIFDLDEGNIIVPINNKAMYEHLSKESIISQLISHFGNQNDFKLELDNQLRLYESLKNVDEYPIGTVFKIKLPAKLQTIKNERFAYLLVSGKLNEENRGINNLKDLEKALDQFWKNIGNKEDTSPLILPLIGTGRQKINISKNHLLRIFIESFHKNIKKKKFTKKITIVITPKTYIKNHLNLAEIKKFIEVYKQFY